MNESRPYGFNVVGFATGNLGLGVAVRSAIDVIRARGFDVYIVDLDPGAGRGGKESAYKGAAIADVDALPFAVNLFVVTPQTLEALRHNERSPFFTGEHLNVALPFWELPILSVNDRSTLETMDAIVAVSDSMRAAYGFALSGPAVLPGRLPLTLPTGVVADRERFGLSHSRFTFVTAFEPQSDPQRKNPLAAINAFRSAFHDRDDVELIVRVNNATTADGHHAGVVELQRLCATSSNITIIDRPLSYPDVLSLYASCDVYVSLHRAEGLGLGPLEAMLLGTPVIATGWSGNMTYMDRTNSCIVPYRLIPVNGSVPVYGAELSRAGAQWAEPDQATAVAWMLRLSRDPGFHARISAAARASAAEFNENARRGHFIDELQAMWQNAHLLPQRDKAAEAAAATSRPGSEFSLHEARIRELEAELRWAESRLLYRVWRKVRGLMREAIGKPAPAAS